MSTFKVGDKIVLRQYGQRKDLHESADWAKAAELPLNVPLTVETIELSSENPWLKVVGHRYKHPAGKFELYQNRDFKVGDRVVLRAYGQREDLGERGDWSMSDRLPLNKPLKIRSIRSGSDNGNKPEWLSFEGHSYSHAPGKFELYKPEEMRKFKVGDTVISIASKTIYDTTFEGWKGTVKALREEGEIHVQAEQSWEDFIVEEKYFELYNEKTYNMNRKIVGYTLKKSIPGDDRAVGARVNTRANAYYDLLPDYWAPIWEENKINIAGYDAEFGIGQVKFGCQTFTKAEVLGVKHLIDTLGPIKFADGSLDSKTINDILSKI